jgi:hypothetical protein
MGLILVRPRDVVLMLDKSIMETLISKHPEVTVDAIAEQPLVWLSVG